MSKLVLSTLVVLATTWFAVPISRARGLTFEERVQAQEAIERVYYSHQIGATRSFDDAVPREVLEHKVRTYLRHSMALERFWRTPVTAAMLRLEMDRLARETRMPRRLRELFGALDDDPLLIQECLARQSLVHRLALNFFAFDRQIHAKPRRRAEQVHEDLVNGSLDPYQDHPDRTVIALVRDAGVGGERTDTRVVELEPEGMKRQRALAPRLVGEIGSVGEERGGFAVRVVLEEEPGHVLVASYLFPKRSWDEWCNEVGSALEGSPTAVVADDAASVPEIPAGQDCEAQGSWDNGVLDDLPDARSAHTAVWTGSLMIVWGGWNFDSFLDTGSRYDPATDTWTPMSIDGAPSSGVLHTAVWTGEQMIVWSGSYFLNTGSRYDPATDTWAPTSTIGAPEGRYLHTAVWTGEVMIVWGGKGPSNELLDSGGRYDPDADAWSPTTTVGAPSAREGHSALWTGNEMIVWGGWYADTGGRYDTASDSWTPTSTIDAPSGRTEHRAVWTGSEMIVWGGNGQSSTSLDTGGRYDPVADFWAPTSLVGVPERRFRHAAVWTGSRIVVWGGEQDSELNVVSTGGRYDPVTDSWTPTADGPWGRHRATAVWTGDLMIVWGGGGGIVLNSGHRYDPEADAWTPTSMLGAPSPGVGHTAVWTGNLMIVWGGLDALLSVGSRYDPVIDSWAPTSPIGAPSARTLHTAVWTGVEMIVWGGRHSAGEILNSGGRYDPLTDSWTETSSAGAPSPRIQHTAVWTGSLMIIWGGSSANTGGRYDPLADSWTSVPTADWPFSATNHAAVWTGSEMIVWGGHSASSGRYDPSADEWSPMSTGDYPGGFTAHTAVWTGSEMIVWGGNESLNEPVNTGGRYDPVTDSWVETSTTNAPSPRADHTTVWTGNLMIVWGGAGTNTGGRYDPITDSWSATSIAGAPSNRSNHTVVWTESAMIIWGGSEAGSSGGRYTPGIDADCDGHVDTLDCALLDPGAFALAAEVTNLILGSDDLLSWDSAAPGAGPGTVHDVLSGLSSNLPVGSGLDHCVASGTADANASNDVLPPSGLGFWYLVRGRNSCGPGTYGFESDGTERVSSVCP